MEGMDKAKDRGQLGALDQTYLSKSVTISINMQLFKSSTKGSPLVGFF